MSYPFLFLHPWVGGSRGWEILSVGGDWRFSQWQRSREALLAVGGEWEDLAGSANLSRPTSKLGGKKWQNDRGYQYPPATRTEYPYLAKF
jgi:hypothetical protein